MPNNEKEKSATDTENTRKKKNNNNNNNNGETVSRQMAVTDICRLRMPTVDLRP